MPLVFLIYLSGFLDKSNIGNAAIAGLLRDLHLDGSKFSMLLLVFFITDTLSEVPSNLVVKKVKANRWIAFLTTCWGLTMTLSGLTQTYPGFIAVRLVLGLIDGGLAPGMTFYLSCLYRPQDLQFRIAVLFSSALVAGFVGGLLAAAIVKLHGVAHLAGWRWIFIIEGMFTFLVGLLALFLLPADVASSWFFTKEEKEYALKRLGSGEDVPDLDNDSGAMIDSKATMESQDMDKVDGEAAITEVVFEDSKLNPGEEKFEWREVRRGVFSIQTWFTGLALHGLAVNTYSFLFFFPTIVTGLGYSGSRAQLFTVPPYIVGVFVMLSVSLLSDRIKLRGPFVLLLTLLTITGYSMAIAGKTNWVRYGGCFLICTGGFSSIPSIITLLANNTGGHYKRATVMGLQIAIGNSSGFIAPFMYTQEQAPKYIKGHKIGLGFAVLTWVMTALNILYCIWENKARREGRRAGNIQKYMDLRDAGLTEAPIGDRHPDFRFIL